MTNILGNTLKRIAERNKENQDKLGKSEEFFNKRLLQ